MSWCRNCIKHIYEMVEVSVNVGTTNKSMKCTQDAIWQVLMPIPLGSTGVHCSFTAAGSGAARMLTEHFSKLKNPLFCKFKSPWESGSKSLYSTIWYIYGCGWIEYNIPDLCLKYIYCNSHRSLHLKSCIQSASRSVVS